MSTANTTSIPTTMKRLVVQESAKNLKDCKIEIQTDAPVPTLKANEVLIKVSAAAVNPSDYMAWTSYTPEECPRAIGNEGCGVVVATGGGLITNRVQIGQKVGFISLPREQGTYSEYVAASAADGVFPMPESLPVEDAASFFVNPYTVLGILDTARTVGKSRALVHTAAASQLGQMMVKVAPQEGMEIINVVRRQEQAKLLQDLGAKHVVVTSESDWKATLQKKMKDLNVNVIFDAVAGEGAGDLLKLLPPKGTLFIYGALAGPAGGMEPLELIYKEKQVKGFLLPSWMKHNGNMLLSVPRILTASKKVNAGLHNGWSSTKFQDTTMEKIHEDLLQLLEKGATGKKLRLRMDL